MFPCHGCHVASHSTQLKKLACFFWLAPKRSASGRLKEPALRASWSCGKAACISRQCVGGLGLHHGHYLAFGNAAYFSGRLRIASCAVEAQQAVCDCFKSIIWPLWRSAVLQQAVWVEHHLAPFGQAAYFRQFESASRE